MSNISLGRLRGAPARLWQAAALIILALIPAGNAQSQSPASPAMTAFENTTRDYVRMHRRLEQQIGVIEFGTPIPEINRIILELAAAIRAERHDGAQGDFFTPSLAPLLRQAVHDALVEHGYTADDVRASARVDGVDYARVVLSINHQYPWALATGMFPCVIEALPPLPPELQYRIVGDDLVLVDIHASLVVDILPRVLMDDEGRDARVPRRQP